VERETLRSSAADAGQSGQLGYEVFDGRAEHAGSVAVPFGHW
jgi:hypothetical protein